MHLTYEQFELIDLRVGTIVDACYGTGLKKPAIWLTIDFGEAGIKKSSAQITALYQPENLIGQQVVAVINFAPKQIGSFLSECLVLGAVQDRGEVVLLSTERICTNGLKVC